MRLGACLLALGSVLGAVAWADPPSTPVPAEARASAETSPVASSSDGGSALSDEDREVVAHLDLLEHLDTLRQLDLLLAVADGADGGSP